MIQRNRQRHIDGIITSSATKSTRIAFTSEMHVRAKGDVDTKVRGRIGFN